MACGPSWNRRAWSQTITGPRRRERLGGRERNTGGDRDEQAHQPDHVAQAYRPVDGHGHLDIGKHKNTGTLTAVGEQAGTWPSAKSMPLLNRGKEERNRTHKPQTRSRLHTEKSVPLSVLYRGQLCMLV